MSIPYLCLTLAQQGGIGYPPILVKLDKWYAVSDSREKKPPTELEVLLEYQLPWPKKSKFWHSQQWCLKKWSQAPRLKWEEVLKRVEGRV